MWFQAIKDASAVKSGSIPLLLSLVIGNILAGIAVSKIVGYAPPFMIASSIIMSVAAGLFTTFTTETGHAKWIGYQVLFGLGLGMGMQQGATAIQAVVAKADIPTGISFIFFAQQLGGAICLCAGQNLLSEELIKGLRRVLPGFNSELFLHVGATDLRTSVDPSALGSVLHAYNRAVVDVFYVTTIVSCLSILGATLVEWKNVKGKKPF